MRVCKPDIQPDYRRSGGIRYRAGVWSISEAEGQFLMRRYDVAWAARPDREVMTRMRVSALWRLVNTRAARYDRQWLVGTTRGRNARLPIRRLLDQTHDGRQRRAATAYGINILSHTLLCRNRGIARFSSAGTQGYPARTTALGRSA